MSVPVRLGGRDSVSVVSGGDCGLLIKKGGQGEVSLEAALVESVHRGALAVCDARGRVKLSLGDIAILLPSRGSLPMIETCLDHAGIDYRAEASSIVTGRPSDPRPCRRSAA